MKTIIKYLSILAIVISFTSCDEESNFKDPNIRLVPVYSVSNFQGGDTPFKINIYRQKDLIVEYSSSVNASSFTSANYMDASSETTYEISVDKVTEGSPVNYAISADKTTGEGTITLDGTTSYEIIISEEDVYN